MAFSMMTFYSNQEVQAMEYSIGCDAYELAWVNDQGGFDTVGCYNSFADAKAAMVQDDYVVRHPSSKSPTKIIAIASGIAYSYPRRNGSTTLDVYQNINHVTEKEKYKSTYVTQHRELFQPETVSFDGVDGNVKIILMGFDGYVKLSSIDLIPMKFIEKRLTITLGGQTNDGGVYENPFEMTPKMSYYSVVENGNYRDLVYTYYSGYNSEKYTLTIGPAAQWMSIGQIYYSKDGYNFYSDAKMENYLATYYSYYMFLPLRSRSNVTAEMFNGYLAYKGYTEKPTSTSINQLKENQSQLADEGATFIDGQNTYGVNALLTYAMACNESGYGRSNFAVSKNNLFGWAAVDSNPNNATQFANISTGITEQMAYNLRGYMDVYDVRFFGMHLGNKESGFNVKYASDPYWGMKIAAIAYDIDKYSKNYDGTLTDHNTYSLGVIDEFKTSYYSAASSKSTVLFTSEYSSQYQKNHIVILKGESNDFYQVQSPNAIDANGNVLKHKVSGVQQPAAAYSFSRSVGYILQDKITLLNEFNDVTIPGQTPEGEFVYELNEFFMDEQGVITISGTAYQPGIYVNDSNQLIHTLIVFDEYYDKVNEARLETSLIETTNDQAEFVGTLDLSELAAGNYYFRLTSDYAALTEYSGSNVINIEVSNVETLTKIFTFNQISDVLWLSVEDKELPVANPDSKLIQALDQFNYDPTTSVLTISGFSFITLMDADEQTAVTHEILLRNMETKEDLVILAETSCADSKIDMIDGFEYLKVNYHAEIDLSELDSGNYIFYIQTTNSTISKKAFLIDQYNNFIPETSELNGYQVRFSKNSIYSYRYELSIESNTIDFDSLVKKPTKRNSGFGLDSVSLKDGKLSIEGLAWIYNVNFGMNNHPMQDILLMDDEGNTSSYSTENKACAVDYTTILNTKFNWDNICFNSSIDLTTLDIGEYRIYMDVVSETYRDIFEANNLYGLPIESVTIDGRVYSIETSKVRDRMILKIEELGE